jgi:hypothetical protein
MTTPAITRQTMTSTRAVARQPVWPKPHLVHEHRLLFREPVYSDGQPYRCDDGPEEDQPAI